MENILTGNMVSLEFCARQTDRFPVEYFVFLDFKSFSWRVPLFWVCSKQATDSRIPGLSRKYGFFYELQDCINSKQYNRYQVCRRVLRFSLMPTINYKRVFFDKKKYIFFQRLRGVEPPSRAWEARVIAVIRQPQAVFILSPTRNFVKKKGGKPGGNTGKAINAFFCVLMVLFKGYRIFRWWQIKPRRPF